jgi:hypothetical protein
MGWQSLNGGFGNPTLGWLSDNKSIWFTSEESGYSHLYTLDVTTTTKQQDYSGHTKFNRLLYRGVNNSFTSPP